MKTLIKFLFFAFFLLLHFQLSSQTILIVNPGLGTLNTAIDQYGGNRIYKLQAGEWYGLTKSIENLDYHLQIIGAEPSVPGGMPATLQTGSNLDGSPFECMFDAKGDISIKNVYIVNADLSSQVANQFLIQSKNHSRIVIDRCVIHPSGSRVGVSGKGGLIKTYFTNNQVIGFGHQLSANDGNFFSFYDRTIDDLGLDTLLVENNTFVSMGMTIFTGGFGDLIHNYVNFNHNTFVMTKSQIDWATKKKEQYWTNNLMFDVQTQPYASNWQPMPGGDPSKPKPNLIFADTLEGETLPSIRHNFVQYNSHYRAKGFYDLVVEINNFSKPKGLPYVYLFPLVWPKDSINCREAQMFNSSGFPQFKYGNTMTDIDPQWNNSKIYEHEARFVEWTRPATYIHALGQPSGNYAPVTEWPQWWWIPSGDLSNNSVWPVFDGTYKNPQTLSGSIENLPLGDLNWFPAAKASWLANKAAIEAHIKSGNTSKFSYTAVPSISSSEILILPNPAKNEIQIKGVINPKIQIFSLDGCLLLNSDATNNIDISALRNGTYIVSIESNKNISSRKFIINK